jgi:hypothetical protein
MLDNNNFGVRWNSGFFRYLEQGGFATLADAREYIKRVEKLYPATEITTIDYSCKGDARFIVG